MSTKKFVIYAIVILTASVALRMARIDREFLGNFGQRQVYNAWVARNFVKDGIDIRGSSMDVLDYYGKKTPSFRDFPVVVPLVAFLTRALGGSIELWGRFTSVIFFAATYVVLLFLLRKFFDRRTVILSLFAFSFFPMSIVYSQSFILEVSALFFVCLGLLFFEKHFRDPGILALASGAVLIGLAFATRAQYLVLLLPVSYLFYRERGLGMFRSAYLYIAMALMVAVPFVWQAAAWKLAIMNQTQSSLAVTLKTYVFNSGGLKDSIFMDPEFYRKMFDDFTGIIFNPMGFVFILIGLVTWDWNRKNLFFPLFLLSLLAMIVIVPDKVYKHDYYFFPIIVPGSVLAGYCIREITGRHARRYVSFVLLALFLAFSLRYSAHPAFKTPLEQSKYMAGADTVKKYVPKDARVVIAGGDPTFLYYCDRAGWTLEPRTEEKKDRLSTEDVLSGGRSSDDMTEKIEHYESFGTLYLVIIKEKQDNYGVLRGHISEYYSPVADTDNVEIYKRR